MQFSTVVQLSQVFLFMNSSIQLRTYIAHHFRQFFINTTSAYIGVIGWGQWGAMVVAGKKHMRKLDLQMGSNEVLLCLKHHKKQPNQWIPVICQSMAQCLLVKGCQSHFKAIQALVYARKQSQQKYTCLLLAMCQWRLVSILVNLLIGSKNCALSLCA